MLEKISKKDRLLVKIVPIGKISREALDKISGAITENLSDLVSEKTVESGLEIPPETYDEERDQYEAGEMLKYVLSSVSAPENEKILAVTPVDLYSKGLNFVFGQALQRGEIALVSLHRLRPGFYGEEENRELFFKRAAKEAVHELGHAFGLSHCDNPDCVMSFSNSILDVDEKGPSFCEKCGDKIGSN